MTTRPSRKLAKYRLTADETEWINVWDDLVQRMWSTRGVRLPGFPLWADAWIPERGLDPLEARCPAPVEVRHPHQERALLRRPPRHHQGVEEGEPVIRHVPRRRAASWSGRPRTPARCGTPSCTSARRASAPRRRATCRRWLPSPRLRSSAADVADSRLTRRPDFKASTRSFTFGGQRDQASYKQVGNGVAVGAAWYVFRTHVAQNRRDLPESLVRSVLRAADSPSADSLSPDALATELALPLGARSAPLTA